MKHSTFLALFFVHHFCLLVQGFQIQDLQECPNQRSLLSLYLNPLHRFGKSLDLPDQDAARSTATGSTLGQLPNFSLAVGDISMPITNAESSMHSAMRILTALGQQLDPEDASDPHEPVDHMAEEDENMVRFYTNVLTIQGPKVAMFNVHLHPSNEPKFSVGIQIKNASMSGRFSYRGPVNLSSHYRLSINDVYLVGSSNLTKNPADVDLSAAKSTLRTNDLSMNVTNMGYISIEIIDAQNRPTNNYMLKILQRVLQKSIKKTYYTFETYIKKVLEQKTRHLIDCELRSIGNDYMINKTDAAANGTNSGSVSSDLAQFIGYNMRLTKLDSVELPEFEHQSTVLGTSAKIQFYDGQMSGLDRIRLDKETRIKLQDEHLFVNASIGWSNLQPSYNWNLTLGQNTKVPTISKGFVSFKIEAVDFDAIITKGINPHTRLVVDQLTISHLNNPKMDIRGLPGMNRVTRGMVNFFMNRLKTRLSGSIQPVLKQQLERILNKILMIPTPETYVFKQRDLVSN